MTVILMCETMFENLYVLCRTLAEVSIVLIQASTLREGKDIRILWKCEVQIKNSVQRLCRVMQNSGLKGQNFLSARNTCV